MRIIQLTNTAIGAVTAPARMPLGVVTRRYDNEYGNCVKNTPTYSVTMAGLDTVTINRSGIYRVTYIANPTVAAGNIVLNLVQNDTVLYTATVTAAGAGSEQIAIVYDVLVDATNLPTNIQVTSTGIAITGGTSNLTIEKIA